MKESRDVCSLLFMLLTETSDFGGVFLFAFLFLFVSEKMLRKGHQLTFQPGCQSGSQSVCSFTCYLLKPSIRSVGRYASPVGLHSKCCFVKMIFCLCLLTPFFVHLRQALQQIWRLLEICLWHSNNLLFSWCVLENHSTDSSRPHCQWLHWNQSMEWSESHVFLRHQNPSNDLSEISAWISRRWIAVCRQCWLCRASLTFGLASPTTGTPKGKH